MNIVIFKPVRIAVVLLWVFTACMPGTLMANQQIDERIARIEASLPTFTNPKEMLTPARKKHQAFSNLSSRMKAYNIPGLSIAVIDNGRIDWTRAYGVNSVGGKKSNTDTIYQAASTSKILLATILLRLWEDGLIDLDARANDYLSRWKIPDNALTIERPVTVRMLLTHQAGLNRPDGGFDWEGSPDIVDMLSGTYPALTEAAKVEILPGSIWQYSNYGYVIIQMLLEDVSGKSMEQLASEILFKPLGMTSSTFLPEISAEMAAREAMPHNMSGELGVTVLHPTATGHGGLRTTPTDLAQFTIDLMKAHGGESGRVLKPETARAMLTKQAVIPPTMFGFEMGEGLGVLLIDGGGRQSFLHPGENFPGTISWLQAVPASGDGAIIMVNGAQGALIAMELIAAIAGEYDW